MTGDRNSGGGSGPRRSLAGRLVLVAAVWSALALAIAGFILVGLYRAAGERAFDAQLDVYSKSLISQLVSEEGVPLDAPDNLGEPRFDLPLSGWYWTVSDRKTGTLIFASASLVGDPLELSSFEPDQRRSGFAMGPGGEEVRFLQLPVDFDSAGYIIAVAAETAAFRQEVRDFAGQVGLTLAIFGAGLIGAIFLQVRFGLKPLDRLTASLAAVRRGDAERIDENLPREIEPVAVELNALITSNREIVERARTHVGNLAHGLKTPLSVISNEAAATGGPLADKVSEQTSIMRTQIDHHLERARMAAQRRVIGVATEVEPVLERLVRAMTRIHRSRDLDISLEVAGPVRFRGEQQDLEEMAGNLIDNACKWARSQVSVTVRVSDERDTSRQRLVITVADDGPGLDAEQRREAVKRGRRLDETVPGTGLGLSIVADLAALYGGEMTLDVAAIGGLEARLVLPAIEAGA